MSSGEIFVTFVLPATLVVMGWLAVYANDCAIKRDEAREKRAPGE
jgi:hypothetical protein